MPSSPGEEFDQAISLAVAKHNDEEGAVVSHYVLLTVNEDLADGQQTVDVFSSTRMPWWQVVGLLEAGRQTMDTWYEDRLDD